MDYFKNYKIFIVITLDLLLSVFALNLSVYIRINYFDLFTIETVIAALIVPLTFYFFNIYKRPWRYFAISDLWFLVRTCLLANIFLFIIVFIFNRLDNIPRLVILLNFFTLTCSTCSARIIYRSIIEKLSNSLNNKVKKIPILFAGTGDDADSFIRDTERKNSVYKVVGLISENKKYFEKFFIRGVPVLGKLENLKKILDSTEIRRSAPQRLVISAYLIQSLNITEIIKIVERKGMKVGRASAPNEIVEGKNQTSIFKEISLEDLLGRRQNRLNTKKIQSLIANRVVLVTGAGGSIGSELALRISQFKPKSLLLIDSNENAVYELKQKINTKQNDYINKYLCSNIRNKDEIKKIFASFKPEIIFHAAALKHVTICEENISEAIRTNALATFFLTEMAEEYNCKCFVLISTDKAVEPSSVMGVTKRLAEIIVQSKDLHSKSMSRFITVRFGNVLGSKGSVVPYFKRQIKKGGPLTVTDKNVSRFFMTIQEAVDLVMSATFEQLDKKNDVKGTISVLDMGNSVKIDMLAKQMIKMAGMTPGKEIKIKYTGLKKGEKMHEKLFSKDEKKLDRVHKGFFIVTNYIRNEKLIEKMVKTLELLCSYIKKDIRSDLFKIIKNK